MYRYCCWWVILVLRCECLVLNSYWKRWFCAFICYSYFRREAEARRERMTLYFSAVGEKMIWLSVCWMRGEKGCLGME